MDSLKISVDSVGSMGSMDAAHSVDPVGAADSVDAADSEPGPGRRSETAFTVPIVAVEGEVDIAAKDQFYAILADNLAPGGCLVLDMAAVTFLDSGGLWALLKAAKDAAAGGSDLLVVTSPAVSQTLALTQTSQFLSLHLDRAAALRAGTAARPTQREE